VLRAERGGNSGVIATLPNDLSALEVLRAELCGRKSDAFISGAMAVVGLEEKGAVSVCEISPAEADIVESLASTAPKAIVGGAGRAECSSESISSVLRGGVVGRELWLLRGVVLQLVPGAVDSSAFAASSTTVSSPPRVSVFPRVIAWRTASIQVSASVLESHNNSNNLLPCILKRKPCCSTFRFERLGKLGILGIRSRDPLEDTEPLDAECSMGGASCSVSSSSESFTAERDSTLWICRKWVGKEMVFLPSLCE
jgi:hypothetical protein